MMKREFVAWELVVSRSVVRCYSRNPWSGGRPLRRGVSPVLFRPRAPAVDERNGGSRGAARFRRYIWYEGAPGAWVFFCALASAE